MIQPQKTNDGLNYIKLTIWGTLFTKEVSANK
jgi:hypothetical protein